MEQVPELASRLKKIKMETNHFEQVTINWRPAYKKEGEKFVLPKNWLDIQAKIIDQVLSVKDLLPDLDDLEF